MTPAPPLSDRDGRSILPGVPLDLRQVSRDVLHGLLLTGRDGALDLRPVPLGHVARYVDGRAEKAAAAVPEGGRGGVKVN